MMIVARAVDLVEIVCAEEQLVFWHVKGVIIRGAHGRIIRRGLVLMAALPE